MPPTPSARVWLQGVFAGLKPAPVLLYRDALQDSGGDHSSLLDGYGCIIESPHCTMSIPLLNLDPSALTQIVLTTADKEPCSRSKPICVTVRGQGGGKTRALEEIRRGILRTNPNVLPIAITFSHHSDCNFDRWNGVEEPILFYALSLVARMASSFYDIDFYVLSKSIKDHLPDLLHFNRRSVSGAFELIREFVVIMMETMSVHHKMVDTLVLLVDETVRMENHIRNCGFFKFPANLKTTSLISAALLNERLNFSPGSGQPDQPINTALLISSLQVALVGQVPSSRAVKSILLAESLDPHAIVEKIWRPCFSRMLSKKEADTLMLTAAMVNNLPRMVESVDTFFRTGNNSKVPIDEKLVSDLFIYLMENANSRYSGFTLPAPGLLYASIFENVELKEKGVMEAFQVSIFTNSLKDFSATHVIQPAVSIMMLCAAAASNVDKCCALRNELTDTYSSLTNQIMACSKNDDVGRLLEVAGYHWLRFRLRLSSDVRPPFETNCGRLLGLGGAIAAGLLSYKLEVLLSTPVLSDRKIIDYTLTNLSYGKGGMKKVFAELESLQYETEPDAIVIRPHPKEAFDLCLKVFRPDSSHPPTTAPTITAHTPAVAPAAAASSAQRPLYIFIDFKSATEPVSSSLRKKRKLPKGGKQYDRVRKMLQEAGLVEEPGGTSKEQFSADFIYIYMCTHDIRTFQQGNALCMGRDDTLKFFGPLASLYQTGRSVLEARNLTN